ncbi:C39 family peptidase [Bacillus sp. EB600]|uniref:C39 family peptidase n=1 Tax=Bacillus sp. EB600 TaxID=2806345 RepID=UPI0021099AE1|nr:C39 family peptidase [Bacillus sp. EB600]MCQ6278445.1 C39 family peptidase [Bacillus sp. EB600]
MNSLYPQIIVLLIVLFLLLWLLKKAVRTFKSTFLFFFIFLILLAGFILDSAKTEHVAMAVTSIKSWFHSPVVTTTSFLEEQLNLQNVPIKDQVLLDAPVVAQFPELPRGCEVTSLAMLLNQAGKNVDKMELAAKIKKDPTPKTVSNGQIYFGNPDNGFVGSIYTFKEPGYGVYHEPIAKLAENYLPGRIKDLTNSDFNELKIHLSDGRPIWVITNTLYKKLDDNMFQTWNTPTATVKITYKEHSVLLTGYDQQYIYFNDPLTGAKNKKAPITDFKESWVQMGSQAITYLP